MIVNGHIKSSAKRVKKSSIEALKEKSRRSKETYKQQPIFAPRGQNTLI